MVKHAHSAAFRLRETNLPSNLGKSLGKNLWIRFSSSRTSTRFSRSCFPLRSPMHYRTTCTKTTPFAHVLLQYCWCAGSDGSFSKAMPFLYTRTLLHRTNFNVFRLMWCSRLSVSTPIQGVASSCADWFSSIASNRTTHLKGLIDLDGLSL